MSATSSPLPTEPEISLGKSYKDTYESSFKKHPVSEHINHPITVEPCKRKPVKKGSISTLNRRVNNKPIEPENSSKNLAHAPSLLPSQLTAESEEVQDEETEFSMSKLIRQASLNSSTIAVTKTKVEDKDQTAAIRDPEQETNKVDEETEFSMSKLIRQASLNSSTIALAKIKVEDKDQTAAIRNPEQETNKAADEPHKIINTIPKPHQVLRNKLRTQKSLNDLKLEELRSTREMAAKKSTDDIKVQIKFWAKAVASNVRHEGS